MSSPLKIKLFQVFFLVCVILFLASVAQAGSTHHHHQGKPDVISPFEKVGEPLHCILNMHRHFQNTPCPHQNQKDKAGYSEFRADCGTQSGSANSSNSSFVKDLAKKSPDHVFTLNLHFSKVGSFVNEKLQKLSRPIDHPPQYT
jgi:hypothetical protein